MAITLPQLLAFSSFSVILAVGQLLFKSAALRNPELAGIGAISHLLQHYLFWLAIALYGAATFLLVYILQQVPLSHVYPVTTALAFVLVPLGAGRRIRGYAPAALSSGHTVHRRRHRLVRARAAMSWGRRWSKRP
jgi:multidrug transporter EmrE-like cation transporter